MEQLNRGTAKSNVQQVLVTPNRDLAVKRELLDRAGLKGRLKLVVLPGEIRILPEVEPTAQDVLDAPAGCLGMEQGADYDYGLKVGGLYEAR